MHTQFVGLVQQSDTLLFHFFTTNDDEEVEAPDSAPTYRIYGPDGEIIILANSAVVVSGETAIFQIEIEALPQYFERGTTYAVLVEYTATVDKGEAYSFTVT